MVIVFRIYSGMEGVKKADNVDMVESLKDNRE